MPLISPSARTNSQGSRFVSSKRFRQHKNSTSSNSLNRKSEFANRYVKSENQNTTES